MKFTITKSEFLRGLKLAQSIADRKSTMPMLANVLLKTSGKKQLLLAATDLTVSLSAELECETQAAGGLTVRAKHLHDIVANLPGATVEIERMDNNWAEIRAGRVKYKLVGLPDRDFPKIPDHREIELSKVKTSTIRDMVDKTMFSICNDETRFHLNGVLFEVGDDGARMVSTDGHRLSKVERAIDGLPKLSAGVIIPKKGVMELKKLLDSGDECEIAVKTPFIFAKNNGIVMAIKLIDSQFPPYEQVIPKKHDKRALLDKGELIAAVKRAQLMSSETRGVKFALSNSVLTISSDNPDLGDVKEEVEAEYSGDEVHIGFDPKYVVDLLNHIDSNQVALELNGELDPGLLRPVSEENYLGVIMPMRI